MHKSKWKTAAVKGLRDGVGWDRSVVSKARLTDMHNLMHTRTLLWLVAIMCMHGTSVHRTWCVASVSASVITMSKLPQLTRAQCPVPDGAITEPSA